MNGSAASFPPDRSLIIYDGDCIFCQNYARLLRLREAVGPVELIDARSDHPMVKRYWREGYDLNEGMLFVHRGHVHHGADAVHALAQLSAGSTLFNRINRATLSSKVAAVLFYPMLKLGRRVTLFLRGKRMMTPP